MALPSWRGLSRYAANIRYERCLSAGRGFPSNAESFSMAQDDRAIAFDLVAYPSIIKAQRFQDHRFSRILQNSSIT